MADRSKIEWTDATWNALKGCTRVSEGCRNCYAEGMAARFSDAGQWAHGLAKRTPDGGRWTGVVVLDLKALELPLHWKKPRRIFVASGSDPFHPQVTDDMLDRLFAVMALCPQHTFQLLTKRPERMRDYLSNSRTMVDTGHAAMAMADYDTYQASPVGTCERWPLRNLWLGVSVENQPAADERIPHLLATPAAMRFLSCEPLLGPVELTQIPNALDFAEGQDWLNTLKGYAWVTMGGDYYDVCNIGAQIDWVIAGGESGPKARPMHPDWVRSLRDQCAAAGVPFFFKQWGEWAPYDEDCCKATADIDPTEADDYGIWLRPDGGRANYGTISNPAAQMLRMRGGKKAAGRLLDGREYLQIPEVHDGR